MVPKFATRFRVTAIACAALVASLFPFAGVAAVADAPVFTTQPGGAVVGVAFTQQPVVAIQNGGVTNTGATGTITLSIATNPSGGTLTCTGGNPVALVSGVATFSGCSIDKSGVGYVLTATWSAGGSVDSTAFTVSSGTPTKLVFSTQPGGGTGGTAWAVQPVVQIQDNAGQIAVQDSSSSVTLTIGTNPGGGTLSCSGGNSKVVTNGVASFSGCSIDKIGTGYTLVASRSGLTPATSSVFGITLGAGTQLLFTTQPTGGVQYGTNLPTQPVVTVADAGGNVVTSGGDASVAITLSITPGTPTVGGPGALSCTTNPVTASSGVATFAGAGCKINTNSGANYRLRASATLSTGGKTVDSNAFTIYSGTPTHLAFSTQPGGGTGGVVWAQQPVVQVLDASSQITVQDSSSFVTLSIGTNPGGGALTCTGGNSKQVVNGVASFSGCSIDKAGTGYTLVATSSAAYASATSSTFIIAAGPAALLVFTTQPTGGVQYGTTLPTQPVVKVTDAGGNVVTTGTDASASITLSITPGTPTVGGPGSLSCTTNPVTAIAGVATFSGCKINTYSGANYKLRASASLTTGAKTGDSNAFTIYSGIPTKLLFSTQPGGGTGGVIWPQQPVVQVQDANSQIYVQDSSSVVTLTIGTNPGGGTLTCTGGASMLVTNGVATFSGCSINKAGTGYTLVASRTGLTSVTSSAFTIAAGSASQLVFTAQPGGGLPGQAFAIQPVVAIEDAGGNIVTTYPATSLMLSIGTNPGGGTLTCTGGNIRTTVNGVATFSGCSIDKVGAGYTLVASVGWLPAATTAPFTVANVPAQITLSSTSSLIIWASGITLTTQFGGAGANRTFTLQGSRDNVIWVTIATLTTDGSGRADLYYRPATSLWYRASFTGSSDLSPGTSNVIRVRVRQIALLRPTYSYTRTVSRGTTVTFTTTVRPIGPTLPVSLVTYQIQRYWYGRWVAFTTRSYYIDSSGRATLAWRFGTAGLWRIRSYANWTLANENSFPTRWETYSVP